MAATKSGGFRTKAKRRSLFCLLLSVGCLLLSAGCLLAAEPPPLKEFSHQKHLKLGNVAPVIAAAIDKGTYLGKDGAQIRPLLNSSNQCEACHRGLEVSEKVSRANMPRMADCLVCHNEIEPPYSCEFCHPQDAQLKPPEIHTANFLDSHTKKTATFDKESCAVCHGRKFTCLGCHLK